MTIMEALGGKGGETIMEVLGGKKGETISTVVEETGLKPSTVAETPKTTTSSKKKTVETVEPAKTEKE